MNKYRVVISYFCMSGYNGEFIAYINADNLRNAKYLANKLRIRLNPYTEVISIHGDLMEINFN